MRWPALSIRAAVLAAIVVGVVLPGGVVLVVEDLLARRAQEPLTQRRQAAISALAGAMLSEPAWTLSEPALRKAVDQILDEPSVCAVVLSGLTAASLPQPWRQGQCDHDGQIDHHDVEVQYNGQAVAQLRLFFNHRDLDQMQAERRWWTVWLVLAQVLLGISVLAAVLSLRLLRPIHRLKQLAGQLAAREPLPPQDWSQRDELGQLGRHLGDVHEQLRDLIGELEGKNAQLHRMAMYDHLTGLPNRTLLRELFAHEAAATRRAKSQLALMFIDLDQFKAVNDTHGHAAGDELLVAVSRQLRDALRESDLICRMGGDEFLVLLPHIDGWEQAAATAERLLQAMAQPQHLSIATEAIRVQGSIGVAMYPADGADFDALVRAADLAMYRSKDLGRARHSFYHPDLDASFRARLALERELGEAIEQGQLRLHYQPVMDARAGRAVGCEALVRWQHPRRGLLGPAAFIPAAEDTGLVLALGRWVLQQACAQLAAWKAAGVAPLQMAVNVSALQLREAGFPAYVHATQQQHGIAAGELVLELTESSLAGDGAMPVLGQLRETGAEIAIDDFGTGYSSLSYLKLIRPNKLKVDRSFVRDLPEDGDDRALVEAVLGMARALGIQVVAEGVETVAQRDWMLAHDCHLHQGFFWARPVPAAEAAVLLGLAADVAAGTALPAGSQAPPREASGPQGAEAS